MEAASARRRDVDSTRLPLTDDVTATGRDVLLHQRGMEISNRELYKLKRDEGMVELRMRLLELRQAYLNQMNTKAALVASIAAGLLSSGELGILNEETMCYSKSHSLLMSVIWPFWLCPQARDSNSAVGTCGKRLTGPSIAVCPLACAFICTRIHAAAVPR